MNGTDAGPIFPTIPFFHSDMVYSISNEKRSLVHSRRPNADKLQRIGDNALEQFPIPDIHRDPHITIILKY